MIFFLYVLAVDTILRSPAHSGHSQSHDRGVRTGSTHEAGETLPVVVTVLEVNKTTQKGQCTVNDRISRCFQHHALCHYSIH